MNSTHMDCLLRLVDGVRLVMTCSRKVDLEVVAEVCAVDQARI